MKKPAYLIIIVVTLLAFLAFKQNFITSASEQNPMLDSIQEPEPVKEPIEIEPVVQEYDSIMGSEVKNSGTVGAAMVIIYKDQIALLKCYGVRQVGKKDSVNEHTIFRLASVSKTISGMLAGVLADEHIINLDDKVVNYLPNFKLKSQESTQELTIRNLLSHTSGLVPHAYDNLVEEKVPFSSIMKRLATVNVSAEPGKLYAYQNVMFSLFDTITAVKTSKKYGELLKEKIFEPFGMNDANTGFQAFKNDYNKAIPHYGSNGHYRTIRLNDRYYSTTPAAGINASISDMGQFLLHLLNCDSTGFTNHVVETVLTPQVLSPLSRSYFSKWDRVDSKYYALGWRIVGYKGRTVAYHGGYVQGYRSEIALCREENIGIAYLTNSPNTTATISVPTFLNLLFKFRDDKKKFQITRNEDASDVKDKS